MYARVAIFQGDPATVDDAIRGVRGEVESGTVPPGLEGAKMMMLVNRETGKGLGVTLSESEEAMRRGDEALNAMNPSGGEQRTAVEFYRWPSTQWTDRRPVPTSSVSSATRARLRVVFRRRRAVPVAVITRRRRAHAHGGRHRQW